MIRITHSNGMASIALFLARVNLLKENIQYYSLQLANEMPHFTFRAERKTFVQLLLDLSIGQH